MKFKKIIPAKVSDAIVDQFEELILKGMLKPGDKLPSERELAEKMSVSRPSVREAISRIEAKGLVYSRRGEGTFVNDLMAPNITNPLNDMLKDKPELMYDVLELRHGLEEMSAWLAARRATETDHEIIRQRFSALQKIKHQDDLKREANADVEFHMAIADASHNIALILVMRSLFDLLHDHIYRALYLLYVNEDNYPILHAEHKAIMDAIINRDQAGAREAAHQHLLHVGEGMRAADKELARSRDAMIRLKTK